MDSLLTVRLRRDATQDRCHLVLSFKMLASLAKLAKRLHQPHQVGKEGYRLVVTKLLQARDIRKGEQGRASKPRH